MKCCPACWLAVVAVAGSIVGVTAFAARPDEPKKGITGAMENVTKQIEKAGEPVKRDMQACMEATMKAAQLGPQHEILKGLAGKWDANCTFYMDESMPPSVSKGSCEQVLDLGGRVLKQTFECSSPEMGSFSGLGWWGYDNVDQRWWCAWMDNMSTGSMMMYGQMDEKTKTIEMKGQFTDPLTHKPAKMRTTLTIDSPTQHTFSMYMTMPDMPETKAGVIVYTKAAVKTTTADTR